MKPVDDRMAWLLQAETPSIVFQVQHDLIRPPYPPARIRGAKKRIMQKGPAPAILSRQSARGNWKIDHGYYGPKFFSTHWSMMLLAELGTDGKDRRFRKGAEFMLDATRKELEDVAARGVLDWSCFWGNLLRYALQAEKQNDPRVEKLIRHVSSMLTDGDCRCRINGGRACAWGVVRALWGLAAIPKPRRTREVKAAVRSGIEFLLEDHRLEKADYPVPRGGKVNPLWFKLSFPLFYQVDILFTLRVLDELDELDHRGTNGALDWLEARRRPDGRWKGGSPFRIRTWREMGAPPETDRWVTLQVLRILRHAGRTA